MDLTTAEFKVLQVLLHGEERAAVALSVRELLSALDRDKEVALHPAEVPRTLRGLHKKRFIVLTAGDTVSITETGLAALKSM